MGRRAPTALPAPLARTQHNRVLAGWLAARSARHQAPRTATASQTASDLTPKEQLLLKQVMNYQHTVELPEGRQLVISPLRVEWLQRSGDLLADTFVDAKGIQPYRRFVRRNIGKYLDARVNMPPAAVLLTAILRTPVADSNADLRPLHRYSSSASTSGSSSGGDGEGSSSSRAGGEDDSSSHGDSSSQGGSRDEGPAEVQPGHPINQLLLQWLGWLVRPNEPLQPPAQESSTGPSPAAAGSGPGQAEASSSSKVDTGQDHQQQQQQQQQQLSTGADEAGELPSTSSSGGGSTTSPVGSLVQSALRQLSSSMRLPGLKQQHQQQELERRQQGGPRIVEELLAVAEVSFKDSTRSQALTLNPPHDCAYLCNMAVAEDWRRRGVASALLAAVEDVCALAGEDDLYLHLRFKDNRTAGSLYQKAGFQVAKRDCWLLLLIGQEPRFLMRKQLDPERRLAGAVRLPGFQQPAGAGPAAGTTAAEQQQQQQQEQQEQQAGLAADGAGAPQRAAAAAAASPAA